MARKIHEEENSLQNILLPGGGINLSARVLTFHFRIRFPKKRVETGTKSIRINLLFRNKVDHMIEHVKIGKPARFAIIPVKITRIVSF